MSKNAFNKIMAGLKDAKAHKAGDKTRGRTLKVKPPKIQHVDVQDLRVKMGLSQAAFGARYNIPKRTLENWEQKGSPKTGAAAAYLTLIAKDPEGTAKTLAA